MANLKDTFSSSFNCGAGIGASSGFNGGHTKLGGAIRTRIGLESELAIK